MRYLLGFLLCLTLAGCGGGTPTPDLPPPNQGVPPVPSILVANRGSSSLSVIDAATDTVATTVTLPAGTNAATPGYVVHSTRNNRIYVGDDANDRVMVLDDSSFAHLADLPMVADVFHIWHNQTQLWATDRNDKSVAVFDLSNNTRVAVIPIPADLQALGSTPHDVVVENGAAYVTTVKPSAGPDTVVKFDTTTFQEVGRATVGEDPHVFLHPTDRGLYVACQDTDNVVVLNPDSMAQDAVIPVFGGHGVWIPAHGQTLYVTNFPGHVAGGLPGPGALGLFAVNLVTNSAIGGITTPFNATHNLTSTLDGQKLYATHTNGSTKVSVYDISASTAVPQLLRSIDVGTNPFGIAYFPR